MQDAPIKISPESINPAEHFVGLVLITPEVAAAWLDYNIHNRPKVKRSTDGLVADIHNGDWVVNGETIKLGTDIEGNAWLIDGQHRLEGCVDAGVPIATYLVSGLSAKTAPTVQETVDTGRKRTMGEMLHLRGEVDTNNLAATLRHTHRYLHHRDLRQPRTPETAAILMAHLVAHPGIRDSVKASGTYTVLGMPKSLIAALHYLLGMVNVEDRDDFFEKLHTGEMMPVRDPIMKLRDWLTRQVEFSPTRPRTYVTAAVAFKAWNYWRQGRLIDRLAWRGGGKQPERYPIADGFEEALIRGGPEPVEEAA